jgi:uncharacterized Zn finger protein
MAISCGLTPNPFGSVVARALTMPCPRCGQMIYPILGATVVKDRDGEYYLKCLRCG